MTTADESASSSPPSSTSSPPSPSSHFSDADAERLRACNWSGCIPVSLSLAPTSLFSPTIPPPIHVLVSRTTFLHLGLQQAVLRLHKFAPPTFSFTRRRVVQEPEHLEPQQETNTDNNDNNNNNNGEKDDDDDDDGKDGGDKDKNKKGESENGSPKKKEGGNGQHQQQQQQSSEPPVEESYPVCWFEDEVSELPLRWQLFAGVLFDSHRNNTIDKTTAHPELPWKIRVHFTQYPSSHLLQLEAEQVLTTIERTFKHSLKQALVIQHGNNKVALNMTKQSHQQLWNSITTSKYAVYKLIQQDIQAKDESNVDGIPVRLLLGGSSKPWIQKQILCKGGDKNGNNNINNNNGNSSLTSLTLGSLLARWAPDHFESSSTTPSNTNDNTDDDDDDSAAVVVTPKSSSVSWRICGVVPPLSTKLLDLWRIMCHPDTFLYISVILQ